MQALYNRTTTTTLVLTMKNFTYINVSIGVFVTAFIFLTFLTLSGKFELKTPDIEILMSLDVNKK